LGRLRRAPLILRQGDDSLPVALSLAGMLDHLVYDCAYLALALQVDAVYVTADQRFRRKAVRRPDLVGRVMLLGELAEQGWAHRCRTRRAGSPAPAASGAGAAPP
jgi:predicted nucleic acid-binding protein